MLMYEEGNLFGRFWGSHSTRRSRRKKKRRRKRIYDGRKELSETSKKETEQEREERRKEEDPFSRRISIINYEDGYWRSAVARRNFFKKKIK